ncbi:hypothetical protein L6452_21483 [Arctium lappa]|uniref:Uncharacterized protein n=1 Tax=Arctium lappa TaxID=4217 RepID=A0ACB9AWJ9_ARCLA|nr:hypothetical protein L6452_21483 [Arctium lappa]
MLPSPPPPSPPSPPPTSLKKCLQSIIKYSLQEVDDPMSEKKSDALLVAASVIAAMNYQAAISPPGGAYQDTLRNINGTIVYEAGQAISAYVTPFEYRRFCISNTISFTFSMTTMFLFLSGLSLKRRIFSFLLTASMFVTITATTYSYKLAMEATTPAHDDELMIRWNFVSRLVTAALVMWFVVAGVAIVVFVWRLLKPSVTTVYRRRGKKGFDPQLGGHV